MARSSKKQAGSGTDNPTATESFASRVAFFPLNVDEMPSEFEKQYLLGGGKPSQHQELFSRDPDAPLPKTTAESLVRWANFFQLLLSVGLLVACWYESTDTRNADEYCPLLYIGMFIGGIVALISFIGLFGFMGDFRLRNRKTFVYIYHTGTLLAMMLLVLLAVSTLSHWDAGGQPVTSYFHRPETVGIRHRYLIWGLALATALATVAAMFGTLSLEWDDEAMIFRWTLFTACIYSFFLSAGLIALCVLVHYYGEVNKLSHPVWIIGSGVCGGLLAGVAVFGMTIRDRGDEHGNIAKMTNHLTAFLWAMTIAAGLTLIFSLGNAVLAEAEVQSNRRTLSLLAGLVGVWGQINTIVAITAASRWRYNYSKEYIQWKNASVA